MLEKTLFGHTYFGVVFQPFGWLLDCTSFYIIKSSKCFANFVRKYDFDF